MGSVSGLPAGFERGFGESWASIAGAISAAEMARATRAEAIRHGGLMSSCPDNLRIDGSKAIFMVLHGVEAYLILFRVTGVVHDIRTFTPGCTKDTESRWLSFQMGKLAARLWELTPLQGDILAFAGVSVIRGTGNCSPA